MTWSPPQSGPLVALVALLFLGLTSSVPSGPASDTCATLEQSRFFGLFSSTANLPSMPCSWTLQNPDPRRYTVYMKITKPTDSCLPRQVKTFQFDSFIETSRTYLGMESFDEVVRLCDASTSVTYLESSKQFLQLRKVAPRHGLEIVEGESNGEFKAEFLVVGKRNPSMPACQKLCQWLDNCLSTSTHPNPCGIMNTPCQCWETPVRKPGGCYRGGVYLEKCIPTPRDTGRDIVRDAEIIKSWSGWGRWSECSMECGGGVQVRSRACQPDDSVCEGVVEEGRACNPQPCIGQVRTRSQALASIVGLKRDNADVPTTGVLHPQTVDAAAVADEWSPWSVCSVSCGEGWQARTRFCVTSSYSTQCTGPLRENRPCNNTMVCPGKWWLIYWGVFRVVFRLMELGTSGLHGACARPPAAVVTWMVPGTNGPVGPPAQSLAPMAPSREHVNATDRPMEARSAVVIGNYAQTISNLLKEEHHGKWEEAQLMGANVKEFLQLVENFVDMIGMQMKDFQDIYEVTENLVLSIHKRPTTMTTDFTFPVKGWRGMMDWVRTSEEKITVSRDALSIDQSEGTTAFVTGIILYRNLSSILSFQSNSTVLNSKVVTVMVKPTPGLLSSPVEIEFPHQHNDTINETCISWDESETSSLLGSWSARSCRAVAVDSFRTKCVCDRLSTFAILARLNPDMNMDKTLLPSVTLIVGCGVSSLTLLLLIIIYVSVWKYIRSERSVILINFCLSIICSNALILVGQTQARNKVVCGVVAALLHFFFLSSFCWVLTEAWQSYMAVTGRLRNRIIRKRFLCLGWGLPALVVAVSVGFTKAKGYGTVNYCWLSLEGGLLYSFVGPAAAVVLVNMVIGILVFNKLVSKDGITDVKLKERAGASLWSSCVILPLLALTWMSAVLAMTDRRSALFQILFAVFDSLEGFIIVMVHCILRREVQEAVKCRVVDRKDDGNGDSGSSLRNNHHTQLMSDFEKDADSNRLGGMSSSCEEKMPLPPQLPLPMSSNFHTLPSHTTKAHMQAVPEYSSHTLTLKREKSRLHGGMDPSSCGKPVYVCDGELFQQLDANLARGQVEGSCPDGSGYLLLPNTTSTLRKAKDDPSKYNISVEQLPQTRLVHLSGPFAEPQATFGLKALPSDRVSVSYSERDSPIQNIHNMSSESHITHSSLGDTFDSMNSMMSKSETISTLSMSSLERQKSRYAELDFEKIMHTRKRHQNMFQDLNRKLHHAEKQDRESPASDSKSVRWSVSSGGSDKTNHSDKQQPQVERPWDGVQRTQHSPPAWVRKDLEPLAASPLHMQQVEWEKAGATISMVSQDIIDLQTEV
ncbi:unnamed protein product [Coregonus sp. 'balchen']|nr:unnamed protein product [Coregonus sp. 'balchen']